MFSEVVVDTNVLMDATYKDHDHYLDSRDFLTRILNYNKNNKTSISLCVDGEWDFYDLKRNKSMIVFEYCNKLGKIVPGKFSCLFLLIMATSKSIICKDKWPSDRNIKHYIQQNIKGSEEVDRILVSIAYNTDSHTLASNEFEDYKPQIRAKFCKKPLRVNIYCTDDSKLLFRLKLI